MPSLNEAVQRAWDASESDYRAQILELMPRGESLLDVGCEDGAWTAEVVKASGATRVSAIEITETGEQARARGIDVRPADLEEAWPFADDSFDIVHANQVIEHVKRLDHFVSEIARVLKPGGHAVVCTENLSAWHNVAAVALGYMPFSLTNISRHGPVGNRFALHNGESFLPSEAAQHIHVLTMDGLESIMDMHGLQTQHRIGSGYYPAFGRPGRWLARRDPRHAHFIGVVATPRG